MSVEYKITDGHRVSPLGDLKRGNDVEKDQKNDGEMN